LRSEILAARFQHRKGIRLPSRFEGANDRRNETKPHLVTDSRKIFSVAKQKNLRREKRSLESRLSSPRRKRILVASGAAVKADFSQNGNRGAFISIAETFCKPAQIPWFAAGNCPHLKNIGLGVFLT
jgi:hypothetical protein